VPHVAASDARSAPTKTALFWKVSSGKNVTYLLGSIHFGSKDFYPLPKEIEEAFESSTALVVEIDIKHQDAEKMQALILGRGLYAGNDLLWNHVSKETRENVERFGSTYGIPTGALSKMKPWMAAVMVAGIPMARSGFAVESGIDMHFLDEADKANDKQHRVVEIESVESQLNLLSGFGDEVQEKLLAGALEESASMPEEMKEVEEVWRSGDADRMDRLMSESSHVPEQVEKVLVQDRNPHMADVAEQFLNGGEQAFVVVGAAHLVGKDGVVRILESRGYKVEQVLLAK